MFRFSATKKSLINRILRRSDAMGQYPDSQLVDVACQLRFKARAGTSLFKLLPETFALVRENSHRQLGMKHYPVQIQAGIELAYKQIIEMQTGEGKTLTASLPLMLYSLTGHGALLATANDYLAQRDAELLRPLYQTLGVSVGTVTANDNDCQRRAAYACDITYGTITEFGFDFLRDRLKKESGRFDSGEDSSPVMRDLHFILADEADSVLLDEAATPLIIGASGKIAPREQAKRSWAAAHAPKAIENQHYIYNLRRKQIELKPDGRAWSRLKMKDNSVLNRYSLLELYEAMERAIQVDRDYKRDVNYVVQDQEAIIVNEHTGRLGTGRKWMEGLHQAIQAVEGLDVTSPDSHAARITIQSLFVSFMNQCGMTGTAFSAESEFRKVYKLKTTRIPTNRPCIRRRLPDKYFRHEADKWKAVCHEINHIISQNRPVLVGTRSVAKSHELSQMLDQYGIEHQVLNALNHAEEADLVAKAGDPQCVTVATNMAGRGTDILLSESVIRSGGLHVILTELHDSPRIDRQLIGRSARQGEPGSYRRYFSLDDSILQLGFGVERAEAIRRLPPLTAGPQLLLRAQTKLDLRLQSIRKTMLYHDKRKLRALWQMGFDPLTANVG